MIENIKWVRSTPGGRKFTRGVVVVVAWIVAITVGSAVVKTLDVLPWGGIVFSAALLPVMVIVISYLLINRAIQELERDKMTRDEFECLPAERQTDLLRESLRRII